jgi:drug/metabolite transporter (DMT)-like permease
VCAFLFAAAATIQQRAERVAAELTPAPPRVRILVELLPVVRLLNSLIRSRLWLLGWVINLAGFFTQAAALHYGGVALVQPLLVSQLLFTMGIVAVSRHQRPRRRDWVAAAAIFIGVAVFLSVRGAAPSNGAGDRRSVLLSAGVVAAFIVVLVILSHGRSPYVHTVCISVAAGLCFAMSAVLINLTSADLLHRGIPATAVDWPGYSLALTTALGLILEHQAFDVGPLTIAIATMSVINPIASYFIGVLAFDVHVSHGAGALAATSAAGVLLLSGAFGLAHSPAVAQDVRPEALNVAR